MLRLNMALLAGSLDGLGHGKGLGVVRRSPAAFVGFCGKAPPGIPMEFHGIIHSTESFIPAVSAEEQKGLRRSHGHGDAGGAT